MGQTKIVAVTGDPEAQIKEEALNAGMDLIQEKPVYVRTSEEFSTNFK